MKTEKCEKMINRFWLGDRSAAVLEHLSMCSDCRELTALDRLAVSGRAEKLPVPEALTRAVLDYAAAKSRPAARMLDFSFVLRHAAIPFAAALMICFGLVFAFRIPRDAAVGTLVQLQNHPWDLDAVDSELVELSSRIEDASVRLRRTAAYTALEELNGGRK